MKWKKWEVGTGRLRRPFCENDLLIFNELIFTICDQQQVLQMNLRVNLNGKHSNNIPETLGNAF